MSGISAIVTAFERIDRTLATLDILRRCEPAPAEILVHVDGNQHQCADAIRRSHPHVRILVSQGHVGPGGGRNELIAAARQPIVASFDDDSYPIDRDYFSRLEQLFDQYPAAWVVDAQVFHLNQAIEPDSPAADWVADFSGGACAYRRERFLETGGYVSLPTAYGMEEVDLALRLHALGGRVVRSRWLRVFHDTDLARHAEPTVTSASIANLALLTYLRYPVSLWVVGAGQCANRIWWLVRNGRTRGVLRGLRDIPATLRRHRAARRLVAAADVLSYLRLRRRSEPVELAAP